MLRDNIKDNNNDINIKIRIGPTAECELLPPRREKEINRDGGRPREGLKTAKKNEAWRAPSISPGEWTFTR